ncbi:MAG: hypothetical protein WEA10_10150 [Actinomycetota bacterium]
MSDPPADPSREPPAQHPTDPYDARPYKQRGPIRGPVLICSAGVLLALAITLPWVSAGDGALELRGSDLDTGAKFLLVGEAVALIVLGSVRRRVSAVIAIVLSIPIAWRGAQILREGVRLAIADRTVYADLGDVTFGPGTWLVFTSALLALAGGVVLIAELGRADERAAG